MSTLTDYLLLHKSCYICTAYYNVILLQYLYTDLEPQVQNHIRPVVPTRIAGETNNTAILSS